MLNDPATSMNLNKVIRSTGMCSRRAADKMIADGRVTINRKRARLGNRAFEGDEIRIDGNPLKSKPKPRYIALYKPVGIVSTTDPKERKNMVQYINDPERLFPIGRLDKLSEGLIFLTNDGDIVNKILRAGNKHEKEYIVTVDQQISDRFIQRMRRGVPILGTVTQQCNVQKINDTVVKIILTQGLNRQIRRMCEYLGYRVKKLKRTRIMNVSLSGLAYGDWRELSQREIDTITKLVQSSSKTEEASKIPHRVKNKDRTAR